MKDLKPIIWGAIVLVLLPLIRGLFKTGGSVGDVVGDQADRLSDAFSDQINQTEKQVQKEIDEMYVSDKSTERKLSANQVKQRCSNLVSELKKGNSNAVFGNLTNNWYPQGFLYKDWDKAKKLKLELAALSSYGFIAPYNLKKYGELLDDLNKLKVTVEKEYESLPMGYRLKYHDIRAIYKTFGTRQDKGWFSSDYHSLYQFIKSKADAKAVSFANYLLKKTDVL